MRTDIAEAERAKEVRDAARAWRRTGFVSEEVLSRILELYPDDRQRFGPGFRTLAFIFTTIAAWAIIGLWLVFFDRNLDDGATFLAWAIALALLTELQRGPMKRADAGAESATALTAVFLAVVGGMIGSGGIQFESLMLRFLAGSFAACVIAAWRWSERVFFLCAGLAGFAGLAQTARGRLLWIVASLILIPACLAAARSVRFRPSHRRGAVILGAVGVVALYGAVHVWSLDEGLVESMRVHGSTTREAVSPSLRTLSILATALLPPALLLMGWRRREPLLVHGGLLLIGTSIATIRLYREVMPLSFALILIGVLCLALALGVRRWLRFGNKGECYGFTADPLFDNTNRTEAIRSVVAMASFTPSAQPIASRPAFEGGGGAFGGGGGSATY